MFFVEATGSTILNDLRFMIERLKFEDIEELTELYKQLLPVEQPIEKVKAVFEITKVLYEKLYCS